jgi:hypothetical protein
MNIWFHFILNNTVTNGSLTNTLFLQIQEKQVF